MTCYANIDRVCECGIEIKAIGIGSSRAVAKKKASQRMEYLIQKHLLSELHLYSMVLTEYTKPLVD